MVRVRVGVVMVPSGAVIMLMTVIVRVVMVMAVVVRMVVVMTMMAYHAHDCDASAPDPMPST